MEEKCNYLRGLVKQAEEYLSLMEQPTLTIEEQLRAKMYGETLSKQGILDWTGYEYLKDQLVENEKKAAPIREHHSKCAILLKEYSDISATYSEILQGDYISKLIEQQRKQDAPQTRPRR